MLDLAKHPPLVIRVLDLLHLDDLGLLQHLDCVEALVVSGLDEMYSAETTGSEGAQDLKISQRVFALCLPCRLLYSSGLALGRLGWRGLLLLLLLRHIGCCASVGRWGGELTALMAWRRLLRGGGYTLLR